LSELFSLDISSTIVSFCGFARFCATALLLVMFAISFSPPT